jgi:hypothetical protein
VAAAGVAALATIRIAIETLAELFAAPAMDPIAGRLEREAGMERILHAIDELSSRHEPIEVEIALPEAAAAGRTPAEMGEAIDAYCRWETAELSRELKLTRRRGLQALRIGVPFLAICLALSGAATAMLGSSGFGNLLSNSFVIIGWVALWRPTEVLLYDWWPLRHRIRLFQRLELAPVRMVFS